MGRGGASIDHGPGRAASNDRHPDHDFWRVRSREHNWPLHYRIGEKVAARLRQRPPQRDLRGFELAGKQQGMILRKQGICSGVISSREESSNQLRKTLELFCLSSDTYATLTYQQNRHKLIL